MASQIIDIAALQARYQRTLLRAARVLLIAQAAVPEIATAECLGLIKGPVAIDVHSCGMVKPEAFDVAKPNFKFIRDLDPAGRTSFYNQYRGLAIKGVVVRSQAVRDGLNPTKGAMQGETQLVFIPPGSSEQCAAIVNKRLTGMIQEKCCDGNGDAPCLLGTGLSLTQLQVSGQALLNDEGKAIVPGKLADKHKKSYLDAEKLYGQKKYKDAAIGFKKADAENDMDIKGLYRWGNALRELEDCPNAIVPLKRIYALSQAGKVWADQELDSRRGIFLLARCHAKMGEASNSVFYLNGFLLEPKKYRSEMAQSLKHKDFGWIHTSKEYTEYKAEAQRKLGSR
jgi:hypothetical protein